LWANYFINKVHYVKLPSLTVARDKKLGSP